MRYLKILADDLTGAADTAARCRRFGLPATIFLDSPEMPLPQGALAFTSDSRHLTADAAAKSARKTAASLPALDARWYKKIDSTLRGNVGSELDALLELVDAPAAIVCPAFPAQRRWLRNGILTAPDFGVPAIHLPSLLREQSRHPVAALSIDEVRGVALATRLKRLMRMRDSCTGQGRLVIAVDAITDDDLDRLVKAQEEALPGALLCGSAGLVGALVRREAAKETFPALPVGRICTAGQTVLLVAGSGSEVAHRQIAHLLRCGDDNPQLGTSRLIVLPETDSAAAASLNPTRPIWLLQQPQPQPNAVLDGPEARRRADHLARVGAAALARRPADVLLLVGGDTAMLFLRQLGAARLKVEQELLPGMPLCSGVIDGRSTLIAIKPGRFGEEGTLVDLLGRVGLSGHGASAEG